ncbi:hypothetical protein ABH994_001404 [Bradyrhizobium yuanmingense]|uniref:hypothetical protein n=1 Tax=Bradyrhizobium yuanmingense TaxID=108015 RepID=UPI0004BC68F8|nr:hypothetical protein [Bradyrhizobium yuanmingense]
MSYQFNHVETFARKGAHKKKSSSRKRSMSEIRDEMIRAPHACPHVDAPREPEVLFGMHPRQAFALATERADTAVDKIGRKLRSDTPVVMVGVASWPVLVADIKADPAKQAEYTLWRSATIEWLQEQWGGKLECVVQHLDEPRPHLHYVVVPRLNSSRRLLIETVHPGVRAAAECKNAGGSPRQQKDAYVDAMIDLQDSYYERVAVRCGLTRLGPRRQRLTREEWVQQQRQATALAEAHAKLEWYKTKVKERATKFVNHRVAAANAEAEKKIETVEQHSLQRIEMLKQKAQEHITALRQKTTDLEGQLSAKEAIIAAQAQQLQLLMVVLEEHGINQKMTL